MFWRIQNEKERRSEKPVIMARKDVARRVCVVIVLMVVSLLLVSGGAAAARVRAKVRKVKMRVIRPMI